MSVAIDTLVPHRAPMLWISALTECTETMGRATASFGADHFAVADGLLLETALVECVAQTVAAALGQRAQMRGDKFPPKIGMLPAISRFTIEFRPAAGSTLQIEARELKRFGNLVLVSGVITCDGRLVAAGELTLHV
jgi:predicted hotdog family 3-hydroxylacyl-ACP dehydratase